MNIELFDACLEFIESNKSDVEEKAQLSEQEEALYALDALIIEAQDEDDVVRVSSLERIRAYVEKQD